MKTYELVRFDDESGDGTFGRFERWVTMEDDDLDGAKGGSIPEGEFVCVREMYYKGGYETFEVTGVPGRSLIKFHGGNTEEDVRGCIALGKSLGTFHRVDEDLGVKRWKIGVKSSRKAHKEFMKFFEGVDEWRLIVRSYEG